jgi:group I intron endonuclease
MATEILSAERGIYAIESINNGRRYVGSAVSIRRRWAEHRRDLALGRHKNSKLQRAWNKYGPENFKFVILEPVLESADLIEREQHWIDRLEVVGTGFNILPTAGSCLGRRHSDETKAKMRAASIGKGFSPEVIKKMAEMRRGTKQSPETIAKRSAALMGRVFPPEVRAKISAANMGRKCSPESIAKRLAKMKGIPFSAEHRAKLSEAGKGRTQSAETRRKISEANLGRKHTAEHRMKNSLANLGKTLSAEHRAKIAEGNRGKVLSDEQKRKLSEAKKGKPLTEEHKQKLKASHVGMTGRKHSPETIEKMKAAQRAAAAKKKAAAESEASNDVLFQHAGRCVTAN